GLASVLTAVADAVKKLAAREREEDRQENGAPRTDMPVVHRGGTLPADESVQQVPAGRRGCGEGADRRRRLPHHGVTSVDAHGGAHAHEGGTRLALDDVRGAVDELQCGREDA